jgi:hypothetical protein
MDFPRKKAIIPRIFHGKKELFQGKKRNFQGISMEKWDCSKEYPCRNNPWQRCCESHAG